MKNNPQFRKKAILRFYEELNDFLPPDKKKRPFTYQFFGLPAIKDVIEALGIPHVEVGLIVANGLSVDFGYHLKSGDNISIYPVFESPDVNSQTKVTPAPLQDTKFILDVHLGKAAKNLRMLGFDTLYRNDFDDPEIIDIAERENRIILTRDKALLKNGKVTHGYWVRSERPMKQVVEIIKRFNLYAKIEPFKRCMSCNGLIKEVEKEAVIDRLEPKTKKYYDEFFICTSCNKIYWKGSHLERMEDTIKKFEQDSPS